MKVPQIKQKVGLDAVNVSAPQVPRHSVSAAPQYEALEQIGEAGQKLAGMMKDRALERQKIEADAVNESLNTQFRVDMQNRLNDESLEDVDINGQQVQRPRGLLRRQGKYADGVLEDYDDFFAKTQDGYISRAATPEHQEKLAESMNAYYLSKRDSLSKYQYGEKEKYFDAQFKDSIAQKKSDAYEVRDGKELKTAIDEVTKSRKAYNNFKGLDSDDSVSDDAKDAVEKAVLSSLEVDMSGTQAALLLDSVKDDLTKEDYDGLAGTIKSNSKTLMKNSEAKVKAQRIENGVKLVESIASGDVDLMSISNINDMIASGDIEHELGYAAIKVLKTPIDPIDYDLDGDDEAFIDMAHGILDAGNKKDIHDTLARILEGYGSGDLSQRRMQLLIQTSKEIGNNAEAKDFYNDVMDWGEKIAIEKGLLSEEYLHHINDGMAPPDASQKVLENEVKRQSIENKKEKSLDDDLSLKLNDAFDDDEALLDIDKNITSYLMKSGMPYEEAAKSAQEIVKVTSDDPVENMDKVIETMKSNLPALKYNMPKSLEAVEKYKVFKEILGFLNPVQEAQAAEPKPNLLDQLTDATVKTEGLLPGQTPMRDTELSKGGRETSRFKDTVQGVPIDWEGHANAPDDRKNFYYVDPDAVPEVIRRQYKRYLEKPERYGLSDNSTLQDVVELFDKQAPENKTSILKKMGLDLSATIKEIRENFDLSKLNPLGSDAYAAETSSGATGEWQEDLGSVFDQAAEEAISRQFARMIALGDQALAQGGDIKETRALDYAIDVLSRGKSVEELQSFSNAKMNNLKTYLPDELLGEADRANRQIKQDMIDAQGIMGRPLDSFKRSGEALSDAFNFVVEPTLMQVYATIGFFVPEKDNATIKNRLQQAVEDSLNTPEADIIAKRRGEDVFTGEESPEERTKKIYQVAAEGTIGVIAAYLLTPSRIIGSIKNIRQVNRISNLNELVSDAQNQLKRSGPYKQIGSKQPIPASYVKRAEVAKKFLDQVEKDLPKMKDSIKESILSFSGKKNLPSQVTKAIDGMNGVEVFKLARVNPSFGNYVSATAEKVVPRFGFKSLRAEMGSLRFPDPKMSLKENLKGLIDYKFPTMTSGAQAIKALIGSGIKEEDLASSGMKQFLEGREEVSKKEILEMADTIQDSPAIPVKDIGGVKFADFPEETNIDKAAKIVQSSKNLEGGNLYGKSVKPEEAIRMGEEYYFNQLFGKSIKSPAFNADVVFDEAGWGHFLSKTEKNQRKSADAVRRIKFLPKVSSVLENADVVESMKISKDNGKTFSVLGKFGDGSVLRVIVQEHEKGKRRFFSVFDVEDVSKKISRISPSNTAKLSDSMGRKDRHLPQSDKSIAPENKSVKGGESTVDTPKEPIEPEPTPSQELEQAYEKQKDLWFANKDQRITLDIPNEKKGFQKKIKAMSDEKGYGEKAKDIDMAIQLYIDSKRNPEQVDALYDSLPDDKKKLIDLSRNLSAEGKGVADEISKAYEKIGLEALEADVIKNVLDNYAGRIWDIKGKAATEKFRKFGSSTRHAKQRVFDTIVQGWSAGLELKVKGATNNFSILKEEIVKAVEDKKFIKALQKIKDPDGNPLLTTNHIEGYKQVEHPNFTTWKHAGKAESGESYGRNFFIDDEGNLFERRQLYAPSEQAKNLNNILGVSKLKGVKLGPIDINAITKFNAITKAWILQTSLFHHMAFTRSYYLGTNRKTFKEMNEIDAINSGNRMIEEMNPIIVQGVRNGLTLGIKQDWNEDLLREKTAIGRLLDKNNVSKAVKDKIMKLREDQADFLFNVVGSGLKAKAFAVEYRNQVKKYPNEDADVIAKRVANLINDDFGGLHLGRMGRNPTAQHIFRLLALAPDWTESNIRTMIKSFKGGKEGEMYRNFWAGIMAKGVSATIMANMATAAFDEDDVNGKGWGERFVRNYRYAAKEGKYRWLDVDITPLYKAFGGTSSERYYFSIIGHFKDPLKLTIRNDRAKEGQMTSTFALGNTQAMKHKASVVGKMFTDYLTGTDYAERRFTTLKELAGADTEKGEYKTSRKGKYRKGDPKWGKLKGKTVTWDYAKRGAVELEQMPSFLINQAIGSQPVQVQQMIRFFAGELSGFMAAGNALGLGISQTYGHEAKEITYGKWKKTIKDKKKKDGGKYYIKDGGMWQEVSVKKGN